MSIEEQLRNDAQSLREVGWFNRAIMLDAAANEIQKLNERIKHLEREIELFREHADYGDVCLVEAILKGEEIGRKEKEANP